MLSTTAQQSTTAGCIGGGITDQQVNHANNMTISNHHFNTQAITPKQPPPPSKPPPPPPPPPRSNCYHSQPQANSTPSSSTTSLHSFNNYSGMTNTSSTSVVPGSILSNGLTSNRYSTLNNDNIKDGIAKNRYPNMQPRNINYHPHGSANLSPRSSMSSHSSASLLHYNRNTGVSPTPCNICSCTNIQSKSSVSSTLGRFAHDDLKSGNCNYLQDHHNISHSKQYQNKCPITSGTHSSNSCNHVCSSTNNDHHGISCNANNIKIGRNGPMTIANDTGSCQSMMNRTIPQQSQVFQASTAPLCCYTSRAQNLVASGNTASIEPIIDRNCIGGSVKNCISSNQKQLQVNHKHNLSDSSCSTTTNTGSMQNNQHHHNLGCFRTDIGSIGCSSDHYGLSSATSTSSANNSSRCSLYATNDSTHPLSRINQPLPPLPSQPPPPPPPPPKGTPQQYSCGKNSFSTYLNPPTQEFTNRVQNPSFKNPAASCNNKPNNLLVTKKSDVPPPLPPPNPGTKMAANGLMTSNFSDSSSIKFTSAAKQCAVSATSSLNNLLNYDLTQPKPRGPTEAELKLEALTKSSKIELENDSKNSEHLGICNYCSEKVKNAKDACRAMGQIFHVNCFICCLCRRTLRGKTFYHVQDKVYCEEDYKYCGFQQIVERCEVCTHPIINMILRTMGKSYHPACFKCCICSECLDGVPFTIDMNNKIYCIKDYHRQFAPKCNACGEPITPIDGTDETVRVVSMDKDYHVDCYCCEVCGMQLTDDESKRCYPLDGHLFCQKCHIDQLSTRMANITKLH